jgi:hypothetical protein
MSKDFTRNSQMDQNLVLGLNSSQSRSNDQSRLLEEDSRSQAVHVGPIDQRVPPAIYHSAFSVPKTGEGSTGMNWQDVVCILCVNLPQEHTRA